MGWAVKFDGVSKRYRGIGPRYGSLRHDVAQGFKRLGRWFSGAPSQAQGTLALDDVSFEVKQGESFAIIGPNGAGKTTALKIVSRISYPTAGRVRVRGRVGALIEVGSGVHPELTARENIWLYGQILGMSRGDVRRRFDEIVDFAELRPVLDTPVKMYSSGMQLRLGFAIASQLDPDVFVVDEALAVGDAAFQAKCVSRMTRLVAEGRSLIFVSHNLFAVEAVCQRGVLLMRGRVDTEGVISDVLARYTRLIDSTVASQRLGTSFVAGDEVDLTGVSLLELEGQERSVMRPGEGLDLRIHLMARRRIDQCWPSIGITDGRAGPLILCSTLENKLGVALRQGNNIVRCRIDSLPLAPRAYEVWFSLRDPSGTAEIVGWSHVASFRVDSPDREKGAPGSVSVPWLAGPIRVPHRWFCDSGTVPEVTP